MKIKENQSRCYSDMCIPAHISTVMFVSPEGIHKILKLSLSFVRKL